MGKMFEGLSSEVFPIGKTNALRGKISNFQQQKGETIPEVWERFEEYILDCPHHGMEDWLLMQSFYHGLTQKAREQLDATVGGSFMSLTLGKAETLMEKIASNQGWSQCNIQLCNKSKEVPEELCALSTKMDVLLNCLEQRANYKRNC